MFSYEQKILAVETYLKCESWSATIRMLGYPSVGTLRQWVSEYTSTGFLRDKITRKPKYSEEQIQIAVDYYL
ncbi:MAG: helix-turn-helix domain containing protein [Clostridiales bacterium]|nr:helix-turn-helix domain containing protein [Clostridiales bacterium]